VKAFSVGGVDYITEPFQVEEVLTRVETHLMLRNQQKYLERKKHPTSTGNHQTQTD
jgi:DNA-binding response OmpR family regulator